MLESITEIVRQAGDIVLQAGTYQGLAAAKPGDDNYVTEYDVEVQNFLYRRLRAVLPGAGFIGEESEVRERGESGEVFIVDPIDGTTNFMHGIRHSAVSAALVRGGEVVLAAVYHPYLGELYAAEKGCGFYCNGSRMRVSERAMCDAVIAFGTTPYDKTQAGVTFAAAEACFKAGRDVRRSGSAVLDLAYLACGRYDGFFEARLSVWDFAAGSLFIREAGGTVTDFDGNPLPVDRSSSVLAGNGKVYRELKKIIGEIDE